MLRLHHCLGQKRRDQSLRVHETRRKAFKRIQIDSPTTYCEDRTRNLKAVKQASYALRYDTFLTTHD